MLPAASFPAARLRALFLPVLLVCLSAFPASRAAAQTTAALTLLHAFSVQNDLGANIEGNGAGRLTRGGDGNFYGATYYGGANANGTLIKLTPSGDVTPLYTFSAAATFTDFGDGINADGVSPDRVLALGDDGNFYGTTSSGGPNGTGTVFKVTLGGALTVLHSFDARAGGAGNNTEGFRAGRLVKGGDGNFYGTNSFGGANGDGTVFKVTPGGALTVLHTFSAADFNGDGNLFNADGVTPGDLVLGSDGGLYGTTQNGGANGNGTVYRITPDGTLTTLHVFDAFDGGSVVQGNSGGAFPAAKLTPGDDGAFYGVTLAGGTAGQGTVFRITAAGDLTLLHSFTATDGNSVNADGNGGYTGLAKGGGGSFYGTAGQGGSGGSGVVYRITSAGAFTVVYNFSAVSSDAGTNTDGSSPEEVAFGGDGLLYGVTLLGGANANGTIYKLALGATGPAFFNGEAALGNGVYYLAFPNGNYFGYYSFLTDPHYIYHFDLGYEYVLDANDGKSGVYLYDFASGTFFYTSPTFPFPYLYDFSLNTVLYYYPDPNNVGRYNTNGLRYFYNFATGQIISK